MPITPNLFLKKFLKIKVKVKKAMFHVKHCFFDLRAETPEQEPILYFAKAKIFLQIFIKIKIFYFIKIS